MTNPGSPEQLARSNSRAFHAERSLQSLGSPSSADPDRLLSEETILDRIRARGFDLIPFEDHVAFRYAYETRYRQSRLPSK